MSKNDISNKDRFDRMSVDIGTSLINLQMMITEFVIELLLEGGSLSSELDLSVPHQFDENFVIIPVKSITYNPEVNELVVQSDKTIRWEDLNIIAQDLISTHLHITFTSQHFFGGLS